MDEYSRETMRILQQCAEIKKIREELEQEMRRIEDRRIIIEAEMILNGL